MGSSWDVGGFTVLTSRLLCHIENALANGDTKSAAIYESQMENGTMDAILKMLWGLGQRFEAALVADDADAADNWTELTRSTLKEASAEFAELPVGGTEHLSVAAQLIEVFMRFPCMWELVNVRVTMQLSVVEE